MKSGMTLTIEQFQQDAKHWLAQLRDTGESLVLLSGGEVYEIRSAGAGLSEAALAELTKVLPKRDIIEGDPEDLVHIDWSSQWRP